ncbi:DNA polymerase [Mesorhizobium sp. M7A.T.Ca.US.000.02.1.1]|nr:DNA polymerase [Mesorhizobium sp. M7A.T.Ca.US.000.02.2.1]RUT87632.1 DNA polymerase [Mesorhizobium sp. M7A.T.Ca.US.000.02.1.1]
MRLIFDIETDGFLDKLTTVHSLVLKDADTGQVWSLKQEDTGACQNVADGVQMLMKADELIGHNIIKFDIPALQKVYPWFKPVGVMIDTLVLSRMIWPELKETDPKLIKRGKLPPGLRGRYSLEAFGYRLGNWKGDYSKMMEEKGLDPWASWNPEMQEYCEQDVVVNADLYDKLWTAWKDLKTDEKLRAPFSDRSVLLEMNVARIIARQERWGFAFDTKKAEKLYVKLVAERDKLERSLKATFGSWLASNGQVTPTKDRSVQQKDFPPIGWVKTRGGQSLKIGKDGQPIPIYPKAHYEAGAPYTKIKTVEFNPGSRQHIAERLKVLYGWRPMEFTDSGEPKVDETVLSQLPWPEARLLTEYLTVAKRIGQIAEGKQAWLKKEVNGRIFGGVITLGAVTRRMTHSNPNIAQVPKVKSDDDGNVLWGYIGGYGADCRELFTSTAGFVLVGCDADALELRCLAGYMARYDGGAYIDTILKGKKSEGTDMHTVNARALGLDPMKAYTVEGKTVSGREIAKVWFYAFIYGAGDYKLGTILGVLGSEKKIRDAGTASKAAFMRNLPALGKLVEQVKKRASKRKFLFALDGGKLKVRKAHAALNTLLQSAGAIIMKVALVILDADLQAAGLVPGVDYEFCANVHDEWQIDTLPQHVETVKRLAEDSIRKAGDDLEFKCPLAGNADAGSNWKETH